MTEVLNDAQVIFEVSTEDDDYKAGGQTGVVIINSVTLTISRDVTEYSGLGNDQMVAHSTGPESASMDTEAVLSERSAEMLDDVYNSEGPSEVSVIHGDVLDTSAAQFIWDELEVSNEDEGDQMVSMSGVVQGLDIEANP